MQNYNAAPNSICLTDLKSTALYFDTILPINPIELVDYFSIPALSEHFNIEQLKQRTHTVLLDSLMKNRHIVRELLFEDGDVDESFLINICLYCISTHC